MTHVVSHDARASHRNDVRRAEMTCVAQKQHASCRNNVRRAEMTSSRFQESQKRRCRASRHCKNDAHHHRNDVVSAILGSVTTNARNEKQEFGLKKFALEACVESSHRRLGNQKHKRETLLNPNARCVKRKFDGGHNIATREKCVEEKTQSCNNGSQYCSHLDIFGGFFERSKGLKNHLKDYKMTKSTKKFSKIKENFDHSSEISYSSSLENEDMKLNQSQNNFFPKDNEIPVIPIGPRFQAEVAKWEDTTNARYQDNDDDLKWLGVQVWPMSNNNEHNSKGIGNGRPDSCSCEYSGSVECVKLHISEAREFLKLEIGPTFSRWKFDEIGEEVPGSWTLEDDKEFESLVKSNPLLNGRSLLNEDEDFEFDTGESSL
ncbi:unnamed protein product [Sphenostylis stenocarpa]|uniref:ELM2 domain-containing protein n=1 Tax=Sphenostylis stenocarpa TaxID=92480 RepID=A0AA86RZC4_9FABA|nr:unnamed protein product [Sphenostylis stenocarpa]